MCISQWACFKGSVGPQGERGYSGTNGEKGQTGIRTIQMRIKGEKGKLAPYACQSFINVLRIENFNRSIHISNRYCVLFWICSLLDMRYFGC